MTETGFETTDRRVSDRAQRKSAAKQADYGVLWLALSARAARHPSPSFRRQIRPDGVYFTRGAPEEWRQRPGVRHVALTDAIILVQGKGTGCDVLAWAEMKPRRVIATDLYAFDESGEQIAAECRDRLGVTVEFRQAALEDHRFLGSSSIDLCASAAVLGHCRDIQSVLAKSMRLLRPGGSFYAAYGSLWYGPGGNHFSGRDGMESIYNHLGLDEGAYGAYVKAHLRPREDIQSGGRYVELDLFSGFATRGYLVAFEEAEFIRDGLVVELSPDALSYRKRFPERWRALLARLDGQCNEDDLIIKTNFVHLLKSGGR